MSHDPQRADTPDVLARAGADLEELFEHIDGKLALAQRSALGLGGRLALIEARTVLAKLRAIFAGAVHQTSTGSEGDR